MSVPENFYSRSEIVFPSVSGFTGIRFLADLKLGAEIGSVNYEVFGKFPNLSPLNPLVPFRVVVGEFIPALDLSGRNVGVSAWSPDNNRGTVDDFFDFFVRGLRNEGPSLHEAKVVRAYRHRVEEWVNSHKY